jgi:outer membrane protein assembly factor BamB
VEPKTGRILWTLEEGRILQPPAAKRLQAWSASAGIGKLYTLDDATGELRWTSQWDYSTRPFPWNLLVRMSGDAAHQERVSDPRIWSDPIRIWSDSALVCVRFGAGPFRCLEARTGDLRWTLDKESTGSVQQAFPVAGRIFSVTEGGQGLHGLRLLCLDRESAAVLWSREVRRPRKRQEVELLRMPTRSPVTGLSASSDDSRILVAERSLLCLAATDGRELWRCPVIPDAVFPAPRGTIYLQSGHDLLAIESATGAVQWTLERKRDRAIFLCALGDTALVALQIDQGGKYSIDLVSADDGSVVRTLRSGKKLVSRRLIRERGMEVQDKNGVNYVDFRTGLNLEGSPYVLPWPSASSDSAVVCVGRREIQGIRISPGGATRDSTVSAETFGVLERLRLAPSDNEFVPAQGGILGDLLVWATRSHGVLGVSGDGSVRWRIPTEEPARLVFSDAHALCVVLDGDRMHIIRDPAPGARR